MVSVDTTPVFDTRLVIDTIVPPPLLEPYPNMAWYDGGGGSIKLHPGPIDHPGPIVIGIIVFLLIIYHKEPSQKKRPISQPFSLTVPV